MVKQPCVYIITNKRQTTLYIGVTSNLKNRIYQHKQKMVEGFSAKYNLTQLVYYELLEDMPTAILREKRLKQWQREWKERLINEFNPNWDDLYSDIL